MSGKNWDKRLRDEERKLSKLLESICAKSDIRLDANGLPLLPNNHQSSATSKVTTSTQTEHHIYTSNNTFPVDREFDETLSSATESQQQHQNASFENVVFEQLHNDYEAELRAKDSQLQVAEEKIRSLEASLIETIKWRNSTCNHLSLLLQTFNQTNHVQTSPKRSNKANVTFISAQQQDKLVKLHHRMLELFEAKSMPVPTHLQSLLFADSEFQCLKVNTVTEQSQKQIDRFSTFHHDYDLVSPVAHLTTTSNTSTANTASGGNSSEGYNKLRVLEAQEEELCGMFFDLLTRIQVGSVDYREINNNNNSSPNNNNAFKASSASAFNFNSLNMANSSAEQLHSIGPRLFLTGLIALEVIDDVIDLRRAMDIFRECTAGASEERLRYLDFIRAMDLLAALKFPALAAMATDIAKGRRNSMDFEERRKSIVQNQRSSSLYSPSKDDYTRSSVILTSDSSTAANNTSSTTSLFSIFPQATPLQTSPKRASIQQSGGVARPPPPPRPAAASPISPPQPQQSAKPSQPVIIAKKREPLSSKALAVFAQGWSAKLQVFLQDFASLKRVISQCFLLTHPRLLDVFAGQQETVAQYYRRSKNYGSIKPERRARLPPAQAMTVTTATGFEIFAINHGLVPELLATSAVRRIAQFSRGLLQNEQGTSYCLLSFLLVAQYINCANEGQGAVVASRAVMENDANVANLLITVEDMLVRIHIFKAV